MQLFTPQTGLQLHRLYWMSAITFRIYLKYAIFSFHKVTYEY